jgi:hypothetical protein
LYEPNPSNTAATTQPKPVPIKPNSEERPAFPRSPSHDSFFTPKSDEDTPSKTEPTLSTSTDSIKPGNYQRHANLTILVQVVTKLEHILEVCPGPTKVTDSLLNEVRQLGATIKFLDHDVIIAIFKNATAANNALSKLSDRITLRHWNLTTSLATSSLNGLASLSLQDKPSQPTEDHSPREQVKR